MKNKIFKKGENVSYWNAQNLLQKGKFNENEKLNGLECCKIKSEIGLTEYIITENVYHENEAIIL